jgi:hypothetical protein
LSNSLMALEASSSVSNKFDKEFENGRGSNLILS